MSVLLYLNDEVRGPEPEAVLGGQDLLRLSDSARQGQHQGRLVHQLLPVAAVPQGPLQHLDCRRNVQECNSCNVICVSLHYS